MSSSSISSSSTQGAMSSKLRALALGSKPHIDIVLDAPKRAYSTLDQIAGKVEITAPVNTRFEDVEIQLNGTSSTLIERLYATPAMSSGTSAKHQFLKLAQPMPESAYPQPRVFEAGRTYDFPFIFVVPRHLLPRICNHGVAHDSVRDCHVQLLPSLGGDSTIDDIAPEMANVRYQITARVLAASEYSSEQQNLAHKAKTVRILPAFDEQPPVNIEDPESEFIMRREKTIKKGLFKGKLGSLIAEAAQPKSIRLPSDYAETNTGANGMATIKLRFDPADAKCPPPRLGSLSSKLKICTWYASRARPCLPSKRNVMYDMHQGMHGETASLSSRCMGSVEWKFNKHEGISISRRDSGLSSSSFEHTAPSKDYRGEGFYTAEILVPLTLPSKKFLIPTFHSCLISRTYGLDLSLGIHTSGVGGPSINLRLPIQISSEASSHEEARRRSSLTVAEQEQEMMSADEFFVPRTIRPLAEELRGGSLVPGVTDLPPEYEALARTRLAVPVA
ncbi:hypothetical protein MBLNU459_g2271t1 [Dothideomycetes sp. NU459]